MVGIFLGVISAASWGAGDFMGGLLTRRFTALEVLVWSQLVGGVCIISIALVTHAPLTTSALIWGAAAGLCGLVGLLSLYRGLALGPMSLVSPISASGSVVPLIFAVLRGNVPSLLALSGIVLALIGIVMASLTIGDSTTQHLKWHQMLRQPGIIFAVIAAIAFGFFYVLLARSAMDNRASILWAIVAARFISVAFLASRLFFTHGFTRAPLRFPWLIIGVGVCDTAANTLFTFATTFGNNLGIISVISSLYPISTVILAFTILRERLSAQQTVGVGVALFGVALMALG